MHYTFDNNSIVDERVNRDQKYIKSKILDLLGNHVHSILLCGGFGRGEGTVIIRDDSIHIINDYDITIVLKEQNPLKYIWLYKKYYGPLQVLAGKLAKDLRMKQIDLSLKSFSYFKNQNTLKIENYEVKHGHVLTYGKDDPTMLMPDWKPEDITFFEGTWLFRNRGAGLLIPALYFLCEAGIPDEKKENFVIECNKAQLAMGDSILLLNRMYHHNYAERLNRVEHIDFSNIPEGETIRAHYQEALEQKFRPNFEKFYNKDLVSWWFEIKELMDIFYKFFEIQRMGSKFSNWLEYADLSKPEDQLEIKTFLSYILRNLSSLKSPHFIQRCYLKSRKSYFISIVPLLLFSIRKDSFVLPYMKKVSNLLGVPLSENSKGSWLNLVRTFLHELHPGGEVANAIRL